MSSEGARFGRDAKAKKPAPVSNVEARQLSSQDLVWLAQRLTAARRRREDFLSPGLFSEPGWEMLLALYEANCAGHRVTSTNLCRASNAPQTTAIRWLDNLVELGLINRRKNPLDARVIFIELEPHARAAIEAYLCDMWVTMFGPR